METNELTLMNSEKIRELLEEEWELAELDLRHDEIEIPPSPFDNLTSEELAHPDEFILSAIMDIENVGWSCKILFDIDLLPFQMAILQQLWYKSYPIFIGSRGIGKTSLLGIYVVLRALILQGRKIIITGSVFRQSQMVFQHAANLWENSAIIRDICGYKYSQGKNPKYGIQEWSLRIGESEIVALPTGNGCLSPCSVITYDDHFGYINEYSDNIGIKNVDKKIWGNGKFNDIDYSFYNGIKKTKIVTTKKGYTFESTFDHKMKVCREGKIVWVRADEMVVGDYILIDRSFRWHKGECDCTEDEAYALGLMIGDDNWTRPYTLGYATIDQELIDSIRRGISDRFISYAKDQHYIAARKNIKDEWLKKWGLSICYTPNKVLPPKILSASRKCMAACLSGLLDTDGSVQVSTAKGGTGIGITFYNTSEKLIRQIQHIFLHFGIITTVKSRKRYEKYLRCYELHIVGTNVKKFYDHIGFRLSRKQNILKAGLIEKKRNYNIEDCIPFIKNWMISIVEKYGNLGIDTFHTRQIKARKNGITHEFVGRFLSLYSFLDEKEPLINQIKELANPDIFYDIVEKIEEGENNTYDLSVPATHEYCANGFFSHNSSIRGKRANDTIVEEFASHNSRVFEEVIAGFGVVSMNPALSVRERMREKKKDRFGFLLKADNSKSIVNNQLILSGTASYAFNHFYKYYERYKNIILCNNDKKKMERAGLKSDLDSNKFCIIRIPMELAPEGFMDESYVNRSEAMMNSGIFDCEYKTIWISDSKGFFKRSLIEKCTIKDSSPTIISGREIEIFHAQLHGYADRKYVYGIDPAAKHDNFAIVILEVHPDHRRLVYCWTSNEKRHKELIKIQQKSRKSDAYQPKETDYYAFCARHIRNLMKIFPCMHISMDAQGGGNVIASLLHNPKHMEEGEVPIWEINMDSPLWDKKQRDTDFEAGTHLLEMVEFANANYTSSAHHNLKNDLEQNTILFPFFDEIEIVLANKDDEESAREFNTLEDIINEIEDLKNELTYIDLEVLPSGRERWDIPHIKGSDEDEKSVLHKDRASALIMANYAARRLMDAPKVVQYQAVGGYVREISNEEKDKSGLLYVGPSWITQYLPDMTSYGIVKKDDY